MKWRDLNRGPTTRLDEMRKVDPYALFGLARGAALDDVKRAYREMVKTYHPDKADPFMRSYCGEALQIINDALAQIEARIAREQQNDAER